jgi:hypothetical protein
VVPRFALLVVSPFDGPRAASQGDAFDLAYGHFPVSAFEAKREIDQHRLRPRFDFRGRRSKAIFNFPDRDFFPVETIFRALKVLPFAL